jgi:hypothetical protein
MKKIVALALVLVMVFACSAVALAAGSPTIKPIEVKPASEEGAKAIEAAVYEQLGEKLAKGEVAVKVLSFSYTGKDKIAVEAAGVKAADKVFILFRDKDGKISIIDATVLEDGIIEFTAAGEGDYLVVKGVPEADADAANLIPKTGDSNRLMKLMLVGVAAIAVMTLAGVAIKRSNNI